MPTRESVVSPTPLDPIPPRPSRWRPALLVVAFVVLNALFMIPEALLARDHQPWRILVPSGELLALVTLCVLSLRLRWGAWLRAGAIAITLVLWVYMWDDLIGTWLLHQTPLLYDQLFLLRHLGVLVSDLWSWPIFAALLGAALGITLVLWGFRRLLAFVTRGVGRRPRTAALVLGGLWLAVTALTAVRVGESKRRLAHWVTPKLAKNLRASRQMYREMQRGLGHSPYANYVRDVELVRKPDIQLFLVESYGRLLWSHPNTAQRWPEWLQAQDEALRAQGWHTASAFVKAPVSGGRSWLAEASILTGISVRYEAVFRHIVAKIAQLPNLVGFLQRNGYEAVLLAPKDRARPGVELENRYDYDAMICHDDLDYRGHRVGWGEIPDQFSLGFAHEHAFTRDGPIFTNFHMVSSHAPWKAVPHVVEDWRSLQSSSRGDAEPAPEHAGRDNGFGELVLSMRRYRRREPKFTYMGETDALKIGSYFRAVRYDLAVVLDYLEQLQRDALHRDRDKVILVMGDHQPPLISDADNSYDVPLHVFSRDPELLAEFVANGFTPGLKLDAQTPTALAHEGLFSLIIRNLARCCARPGTPLPEVIWDGVRIGSPDKW